MEKYLYMFTVEKMSRKDMRFGGGGYEYII